MIYARIPSGFGDDYGRVFYDMVNNSVIVRPGSVVEVIGMLPPNDHQAICYLPETDFSMLFHKFRLTPISPLEMLAYQAKPCSG